MAISPETRSRTPSAKESDYDAVKQTRASSGANYNQDTDNTNTTIGYLIAVLAVIAVGYFGYAYYWPSTNMPVTSTQTMSPAVPAPVTVTPPAPAVTTKTP